MKSSIEKKPHSIVELTIEEESKNLLKLRKKVLTDLAKNANIKGFRKGWKIPEDILVKHYSEAQIATLIVDEALQSLYGKALKEHALLPVTQWEITQIISQDPLKVVLKVEVFPEVVLDEKYKKVKLKKTHTEVWDNEVENALQDIQTRFTHFDAVKDDYQSKMWDKVYINTQGFDLKWKHLAHTDMQNYPLILWSNILVPWFEEWMVGKKVWENFELDVTFPKDYHNKDFAGKKTKFKVDILKIESAHSPEFTPEFIKQLRWKDLDLEWFKSLLKQEILETKELNARMQDETQLIDALSKYTTFDYGEKLLEQQIKKVFEEVKQNISQSGAKVADYIASLWLTENDYIEQNIKPIAIKRLTWEFILHKLSQTQNITISSDEIQKEIDTILKRFESPDVLKRLKELYVEWNNYYEELKQRLVYRKIIDSFFE